MTEIHKGYAIRTDRDDCIEIEEKDDSVVMDVNYIDTDEDLAGERIRLSKAEAVLLAKLLMDLAEEKDPEAHA